jgi:hypothetical protein
MGKDLDAFLRHFGTSLDLFAITNSIGPGSNTELGALLGLRHPRLGAGFLVVDTNGVVAYWENGQRSIVLPGH